MHMARCAALALGLGLGLGLPANGDVWDVQTIDDNGPGTHNELIHGADQLHDLGALPVPDEDWYRLEQAPHSSYEIVVDAASGDIGIGSGPHLQRIGPDGTTVLQDSGPVGVGSSRSLRWENTSSSEVPDEYVRVRSASCTTDCGPADSYRIRTYETTYSVPRFNNSGSQVTVLALHNPASYTIMGNAYFWSPTGALLVTQAFALPARNALVLNTSTIAALSGTSGSITVANDGQYGDLTGKTVALEPSTGFSFDTPLLARPSGVAPPRSMVEATTCDPDGIYTLTSGGPIVYSCCFGIVNVNITSFTFLLDGANVIGLPTFAHTMTGAPTTCPSGAFDVVKIFPGGCTETYRLMGTFTGADTWSATFTAGFTGASCTSGLCASEPCMNQSFPVTATR